MRLMYYFDTWTIIWQGIVQVFMKICTDLQRFEHKIVFVIVSEQFYALLKSS